MSLTDEFEGLFARLSDLCRKAEVGLCVHSDFMSPRELYFASEYLRAHGTSFFAYGGYADAERRRVYILPDYMPEDASVETLAEYGHAHGIALLSVSTSGYRTLTHRDFLGSVLGLGIDRSVVGDILVGESTDTLIFCDEAMAQFIASELSRVANDKVSVRRTDISGAVLPKRKFEMITDTVASARIDCVVGALCSLSRDKAKQTVVSGLVEVNYLTEERPDRQVTDGAVISVRGKGKYRILSVGETTKKGRYRLSAEKYL